MQDIPVVDFHAHLGNWGRFSMLDTPELFLKCMDNAGIDVACLNCIFHGDSNRGNDRVAEYVRNWPKRFVGAAFISANYPEEMVPELERCFGPLGMKFIKIYPHYVRVSHDDPLYFPIYEFANERGLAIMSHATHYFDPPSVSVYKRYENLVKRFPRINWVMAHAGAGKNDEIMRAVRDFPTIYVETCGSRMPNGGVEYAVKHSRADRVLFGTDMPLFDASQQLAKVAVCRITDEEKKMVLGGNAIRLLNLKL